MFLKPRGASEAVPWDIGAADDELSGLVAGADAALDEVEFVALDVETTGNSPFLVLEIGAERFDLAGPLSLFDTLVDCRAPINTYARKRHQIYREMLAGAPGFTDARRAFLRFARGTALVEHSHDAFDTFLIGRGLKQPLLHPVIDTSALARLVLGLPSGQTPGLAAVVAELGVDATPAHAALSDAQATAAVFRELVGRARERFQWRCLGDLLAVLERPAIDRSALELPRRRGPRGEAPPRPPRRQPRSGRDRDAKPVEGSTAS
ncbi:MAG TPA: 3'-5' exonuclease [Candidatus Dormibacteraeota bacterium]|nr:3'-5' exonuclease [Candidatus Dormibacteraeota bacterium]